MKSEKVLLGLGALITADLLYHGVKYCYNLLYKDTIYMKLEIIRNIPKEPSEEKSVFWKQGEFFFGDQSRIATMTDVQFINKDTLVACHRAAAEVYLIKIINNTFQIIDSIVLDKEPHKYGWGRAAFHPDLMSYHEGIIYLSEYGPNYCIVEVSNDKLVYVGVYKGNNVNLSYHGILANDNGIYLGGCNPAISTYIKNNKYYNLLTSKSFTKERVKMISSYNDLLIMGFDTEVGGGAKGTIGDTIIRILKHDKNNLQIIDESILIKNAHPDGAVVYKDYYLFTRHCSIKRCGIISICKIYNNKLELVKEIECENFPHGIDVNENRIVYTSYAKSAIFMIDFPKIK